MNFENFLELFVEQFDDLEISEITRSTKFKQLQDYSSLVALLLITMIDEEYDVTISGDEMVKVSSVGELFDLVKSKK